MIAVWISRVEPVSMRSVPLFLNWRTEGIEVTALVGEKVRLELLLRLTNSLELPV